MLTSVPSLVRAMPMQDVKTRLDLTNAPVNLDILAMENHASISTNVMTARMHVTSMPVVPTQKVNFRHLGRINFLSFFFIIFCLNIWLK